MRYNGWNNNSHKLDGVGGNKPFNSKPNNMTRKLYDIELYGKGGGDPVPDPTNLDNWIGWLRKRVSIQNHEVDYLKLAMSEFSQQEAIAFAEWTQKNYYEHDDNGLWYKWLLRNRNEDPSYTAEQLYSLFKTKNNG